MQVSCLVAPGAVAGVEDDLGAGEVEAGVVPPDLALLAPQPVLVTPLVMARPHPNRLVQVLTVSLYTL